MPDAEEDGGAAGENRSPSSHGAVERDGFNLHATVAIAADDDIARERLMRYGARPPIALDRLRWLPGGRVAYRIKGLRDGRAKHRVMTPLEFLARLAAIVPPPRYPLPAAALPRRTGPTIALEARRSSTRSEAERVREVDGERRAQEHDGAVVTEAARHAWGAGNTGW